jgi:hypothetical protein
MQVEGNGGYRFWVTALVGVVCALIAVVGTMAVTKENITVDKYLTVDRHNDFEKHESEKFANIEKEIGDVKIEVSGLRGELHGLSEQLQQAIMNPGKKK